MTTRRTALPAALLCISTAAASGAAAQADSALAAALRENRHTLHLDASGQLAGPGARLLVDGGRGAQFFLIGEEHGVAQVPQLASALFRALAPHGYRHLAVETGHPGAAQLNRLAREADPERAIGGWVRAHWPGVPFYNLGEEARLLADAVAAAGGGDDVVWGLDYDILADRYALRRLRDLAPTPAARRQADALLAHGDSLLVAALAAENPGMVLMFSPADSAVAGLQRAYAPAAGSEADEILRLLEATLRINGAWREGRGYESNVLRAAHLKHQLMRHYRRAAGTGREPRVMVKLGANHLLRGRTWAGTFDVGTLAHELAEANGGSAFGVLVVGGRDTKQAVIDPRTLGYQEAPAQVQVADWARPLFDLADAAAWTVFDLRALRPLAAAGRLGTLPPPLAQVVFGFDAMVILTGSGPSHAFER